MPTILLRIRGPDGVSSCQLEHDDTVATLQRVIADKTGISASRQELRVGFPPKLLELGETSSTSLEALGIKSGEQIVAAASAAPVSTSEAQRNATATQSAPLSASAQPPSIQQRPQQTPNLPSLDSSTSGIGSSVRSMPVDGGHLILRVVPDDNSCLFTSCGLLLEPGKPDVANFLRKTVADSIRADPETWSDAMLGRPRDKYIKTILSQDSWGGAIELSILAQKYETVICSIDVQTGRVDRFGDGFGSQCLVVYSGIHYDALTFSYMDPNPSSLYPFANELEFDVLKFESDSPLAETILNAAGRLVTEMRKDHAYTDAATFTLKCQQCGAAIKGEVEARAHAQSTGHTQFGEYDG
ncbi:ubiquitin-specific protease otu1 [Microbotryomycetes sp. JL221]|nr:ubiquitin-specific protease otu1 [Microbotryomycetes sp. JL221]